MDPLIRYHSFNNATIDIFSANKYSASADYVYIDSLGNKQDIYFSEFAYPLRGARYSERFGTNVFLANFEFRFPFIQYFQLGFPMKVIFGNIRGHIFMDIGAAWDDRREFSDFAYLQAKYGNNLPDKFSPWVRSIGYGIKIPFIYLLFYYPKG